MLKNKVLRVALIVLVPIIVVFFWFYSSFNGNPYMRMMAQSKINQYLEENYPGKEFVLENINFDFKSGMYSATIVSKNDKDIFFTVLADGKMVKYDEYKFKYLEDKEIEKKFIEQIKGMLFSLIKNEIKELERINVEMYIPKGKYSKETNYSKAVDEELKIFIYLHSPNTPKLSQDQFLKNAIRAKELILKNDYRVEYFSCYYMFKQRGDGYSIELYKDELHESYEEIMNTNRVVDYEKLNKSKARREF